MIAITADALDVIVREAPQSADGLETGGILLGHDLGDRIIITMAGDPGPRAQRKADRFVRDLEYARALADKAYDRDYSVWIGEWHTHPTGPASPSPRDMNTYEDLLANDELDFARIASLIATPCRVHGWTEIIMHPWIITPEGAQPTQLDTEASGTSDE